jgi:hypothetical protein
MTRNIVQPEAGSGNHILFKKMKFLNVWDWVKTQPITIGWVWVKTQLNTIEKRIYDNYLHS